MRLTRPGAPAVTAGSRPNHSWKLSIGPFAGVALRVGMRLTTAFKNHKKSSRQRLPPRSRRLARRLREGGRDARAPSPPFGRAGGTASPLADTLNKGVAFPFFHGEGIQR